MGGSVVLHHSISMQHIQNKHWLLSWFWSMSKKLAKQGVSYNTMCSLHPFYISTAVKHTNVINHGKGDSTCREKIVQIIPKYIAIHCCVLSFLICRLFDRCTVVRSRILANPCFFETTADNSNKTDFRSLVKRWNSLPVLRNSRKFERIFFYLGVFKNRDSLTF